MKKIEKKIISVALAKPEEPKTQIAVQLTEALKRPDMLSGKTYKIKPPMCESALYITINDITLNKGTPDETLHPFEIFIASKNMHEYQWVAAFTRVASAVFRKGGDITFIVEELKSVQDPNGGYFSRRGTRMSSVVAEIGYLIEDHFKSNGIIKTVELPAAVLAAKEAHTKAGGLSNATDCPKCGISKCVILMDGCPVCTECGDSKCG